MKTVEEFYKEIDNSEELQNELKALKNGDEFAEFLKKHECGASVKEFTDYVASLFEGEIGDDEAEAAAGGYRTRKVCKDPGRKDYDYEEEEKTFRLSDTERWDLMCLGYYIR